MDLDHNPLELEYAWQSSLSFLYFLSLNHLNEISHLGRVLQLSVVEQGMIDSEHDPVEQSAVQRFSHGVTHSSSLKQQHTQSLKTCQQKCERDVCLVLGWRGCSKNCSKTFILSTQGLVRKHTDRHCWFVVGQYERKCMYFGIEPDVQSDRDSLKDVWSHFIVQETYYPEAHEISLHWNIYDVRSESGASV